MKTIKQLATKYDFKLVDSERKRKDATGYYALLNEDYYIVIDYGYDDGSCTALIFEKPTICGGTRIFRGKDIAYFDECGLQKLYAKIYEFLNKRKDN